MKSKWIIGLGVLLNCLGFSAQAFEGIEANLKYPVGMGASTSGYSSTIGFGASFYMKPVLNDSIPNYISIGYQSYKIRADGTSQLHLIPVVATLEMTGKVFKDFQSTLGVGAGAAAAFVGVNGQTSFNWSGYFVAQIKPGFQWVMSEGLDLVGHAPVSLFFSRAFMSSMDFDLGVKFSL